MENDSTRASRKARQAKEAIELARARLRSVRSDEVLIEQEYEQNQLELHRAKAELTTLLGTAYGRRMAAGEELHDIAHRALLPVEDFWRLLSGTYEVTESDWIKRTAAGFMATDRDWNAARLRDSLTALHEAATQSQNIRQRREMLYSHASDAEKALMKATTELATLAVESERGYAPPIDRYESPAPGERLDQTHATPDVQGYESKPDPLLATSKAEFLDMLEQYRGWAGNPSYRDMAERVPGGPSYTTLANILRRKVVPKKLKTLEAFIRGAGGDEADVRRWATAWRRLNLPGTRRPADQPDEG
jgi:hypothetical protein